VPKLPPDSRVKFDRFKDLLALFATGEHSYKACAARVWRRLRGEIVTLRRWARSTCPSMISAARFKSSSNITARS
jgi:hypothetical protein